MFHSHCFCLSVQFLFKAEETMNLIHEVILVSTMGSSWVKPLSDTVSPHRSDRAFSRLDQEFGLSWFLMAAKLSLRLGGAGAPFRLS